LDIVATKSEEIQIASSKVESLENQNSEVKEELEKSQFHAENLSNEKSMLES